MTNNKLIEAAKVQLARIEWNNGVSDATTQIREILDELAHNYLLGVRMRSRECCGGVAPIQLRPKTWDGQSEGSE